MHGPQKAKISNRLFNKWLIKQKYNVIGREFAHSIQSGGWPDFIVRKKSGKVEFFEVKSGNHRVDPHQLLVLKILRKIGRVHIMRLDKKMKKFNDETPKELK